MLPFCCFRAARLGRPSGEFGLARSDPVIDEALPFPWCPALLPLVADEGTSEASSSSSLVDSSFMLEE